MGSFCHEGFINMYGFEGSEKGVINTYKGCKSLYEYTSIRFAPSRHTFFMHSNYITWTEPDQSAYLDAKV